MAIVVWSNLNLLAQGFVPACFSAAEVPSLVALPAGINVERMQPTEVLTRWAQHGLCWNLLHASDGVSWLCRLLAGKVLDWVLFQLLFPAYGWLNWQCPSVGLRLLQAAY